MLKIFLFSRTMPDEILLVISLRERNVTLNGVSNVTLTSQTF